MIEKMARDRGVTVDLEAFRAIDGERRKIIHATETKKAERNKASEEIARLKKAEKQGGQADLQAKAGAASLRNSGQGGAPTGRGKETGRQDALRTDSGQAGATNALDTILAQMKALSEELKRNDERIAELDSELRQFLLTVPNIPHASVPVGHGAAENIEVRRWGAPPKFDFAAKPHWEIGEGAGIIDFEAAIKIAGSRFVVYKALGARLERAIANFFLDVHTRESGFTEILPPFLVNTQSLTGVGQLPKFAADMFHLEGTDLWLTPTAEVELTSYHREETLDADTLPVKMCAWTACFRSEAGAAGKDTRGMKRQHQFQKVELFKFTRPEQSYEELESLVRSAELVLQKLGLHYRVVLLCTGDMGFASSKTYDIEVWLPSSQEFM
ncbi:MAG TPA: serine--tRNA ligase, partial [Candidatus Acidoferrales bacterium]|nr:serine--tRNA ligase [Candidatus Acidoferrales bacterium]